MIKLTDILHNIILEAKDKFFNVNDYSADTGDSKKDQAAPGYSARSTGGTTIDRTPRQDFKLGKGKGHEGWFDSEIQYNQNLKSIVDRYHVGVQKRKERGTTTRPDTEKGITKFNVVPVEIRVPEEDWAELMSDKRNITRRIRNILTAWAAKVTSPDYTDFTFEPLTPEALQSWIKSIKIDPAKQIITGKVPTKVFPDLKAALSKLYPRRSHGAVSVGRPGDFERQQANTALVNKRRGVGQSTMRQQAPISAAQQRALDAAAKFKKD